MNDQTENEEKIQNKHCTEEDQKMIQKHKTLSLFG